MNFRLNISFTSSFNVVIKKSISFKLLNKLKTSTNIVMIGAVVFYKLNFRKNKIISVKYYFIMMFEIDDALTIYRDQNDLKIFLIEINKMSEIFIKKFSLKIIKTKFYFDFYDLLQTFDSIIIKIFCFIIFLIIKSISSTIFTRCKVEFIFYFI